MNIQTAILVIAISYMIGSFPTAYLVGKLNGINIFEHGSGNMGTTNTLRTLGTLWGGLVMVIDVAKGVVAVLIARELAPPEPLSTQASASVISAIAVVVGHNWSLLASLLTGSIRGGKGVATAGGTWIVLMPAFLIVVPVLVIALVVLTTRYMSLGVLTAALVGAVIVVAMVLMGSLEPVYLIYLLISAMIVLRHRANIKRLLAGNESRVGDRVQISK
jgi:acyl phosphate:glycerol-3-phosphate acyltransferase